MNRQTNIKESTPSLPIRTGARLGLIDPEAHGTTEDAVREYRSHGVRRVATIALGAALSAGALIGANKLGSEKVESQLPPATAEPTPASSTVPELPLSHDN